MSDLAKLQDAIRRLRGCESEHVSTVAVRETFNGAVAWHGDVEVFNLRGHPKARRCYAWAYQDDDRNDRYTAVIELPPVDSAQTAVRAAIVAQFKNEKT